MGVTGHPTKTMLNDIKSQLGSSLHTMRRFLERPISVDKGRVSLGKRPSTQRALAKEAQRRRDRQMRHDLYQLLEQHPSSRQLVRHLDLVERTLRRGGLEALEALPIRVITKALTQLEMLVRDWSPTGLAELRSRMAVMVKTRPPETAREAELRESRAFETGFDADVSEVEHSVFEEMERSWFGQLPEAVATAAPKPQTA
jgi:hypothetical protein